MPKTLGLYETHMFEKKACLFLPWGADGEGLQKRALGIC